MGKQADIKLQGTVDNLIFYQWKGVYSIRTKPSVVRQTKSTIQQSNLFGLASHTGAKLRNLLKPALPDAKDRNMMRRFEQAIAAWLRAKGAGSSMPQTDLPFITGFDFNEESELGKRLKVTIAVSVNAANNLVVDIPDMVPIRDIAAPANTTGVSMLVQAAVCSLQDDVYNNSAGKSFNLLYNNDLIPSQQIEFPFQITAGSMAVVMISLAYTIPKSSGLAVVKDKRWMPAGVVGAVSN